MRQILKFKSVFAVGVVLSLVGCQLPEELADVLPQEDQIEDEQPVDADGRDPVLSALDLQLADLITRFNLNAHPQRDLPSIQDALPQLGKKLFFTKSLGGQFDSACVTCHHPSLGGADGLSLSVGVDASLPDLLGPGREHKEGLPLVPRNAPTIFNVGLWDMGLFHDSRVESLNVVPGTNGIISDIRTPDSDFGVADILSGNNLASAQAAFPVTSVEEMRGNVFEAGSDNNVLRDHLAARIGDYAEGENALSENGWLTEFQTALGSNASAEELISFENIAHALGEYERSMVFTDHPWQQYMDGNTDALNENEKAGAVLFFTAPNEGGAGCAACHNGQLFSDEQHHVVAFPQIGPGKGDGVNADDDFGRERETGVTTDRYRFRTGSLLNLNVTAPYGHSGSLETLEDVVRHYINPDRSVDNYFGDDRRQNEICRLDQFDQLADCEDIYPNAQENSELAVNKLQQEQNAGISRLARGIRLNNTEVDQLVLFLKALTDPCVENRDCLSDWIPSPDDAADEHQLNAVNRNGAVL